MKLLGHLQVAEARAHTCWPENGRAGGRRYQHLGEVERQIRGLFSLACRSCAPFGPHFIGQSLAGRSRRFHA